jgi:hypothetical protein
VFREDGRAERTRFRAHKIVTVRFDGTSAKIVATGNFQLSATGPSEIYVEQ